MTLAQLVWDGGSWTPRIPQPLIPDGGIPAIEAAGQFIGTSEERLCEIAGRCCYDSFGRGRNSAAYHEHILQVGHTSVLAHATITLDVTDLNMGHKFDLARLPGVWIDDCEMSINLRTIVELHKYDWIDDELFFELSWHGHQVAPQICDDQGRRFVMMDQKDPSSEECKWISVFLQGSRGMSHEQVRHGYRTAISQRSTRYVDEDGSPWMHHPLVQAYISHDPLAGFPTEAVDAGRKVYKQLVAELEPWLISRGVDKFTARKQARGAARGYLGNALCTELVFSASVAQWKRMLLQRCTIHADAEIRQLYCQALSELKGSQHGLCFYGWTLVDSPDGLGQVLDTSAELH